ncbi:helicase C-terminal domain-containing protein [Polychytrium aggregatum]|uniref:helicase C-terminal domain-containing protein n=1 Tax=Polychytrium aggregatum TaxID=110093 RepID=UPI0022FE7AEB|nr:helicase C-terminal domain-containing protein [Polychytrium aggregatum]KAI9203774.1 helicase C-terminal domain-containing protein [Polychytrium aggregatum]
MPTYTIRGIQVEFPYDAYECQIALMERVIGALETGNNALIESPTGTGKTVCLLCAALAWRSAFLARSQRSQKSAGRLAQRDKPASLDRRAVDGPGQASNPNPPAEAVPTIYFSSRTHSQLTQAIHELRNTSYRPRMAPFGSRDQMCIHPQISNAPSSSIMSAQCVKSIRTESCSFYRRVDVVAHRQEFAHSILDIEELVSRGAQHQACPYYISKHNVRGAEVVFVPYSYLIDPLVRKSLGITLSNAVIIFDEAHNMESACTEAASFELTPTDLANAIIEIRRCQDIASSPLYPVDEPSVSDFAKVEDLILRFEAELSTVSKELDQNRQVLKEGSFIFELFSKLGITFTTIEPLFAILSHASLLLAEGGNDKAQPPPAGIYVFKSALEVAFRGSSADLADTCKSYKVFIQEVSEDAAAPWKAGEARSSKTRRLGNLVINFWCMNAGVVMKDLSQNGVRSIVMASGTLNPLDGFAMEMGIPFPYRLENPHIIDPQQMLVLALSRGPSEKTLNSSYANRHNPEYIQELGSMLANFVVVIPDGMLVFFPSYAAMKSCCDYWAIPPLTGGNSIINRIKKHKDLVIEPRGKEDFGEAMKQFYDKLNDGRFGGAVFFAVCRGKASEGLDFSDARGRAVVICGIPFSATTDPKVNLKKNYLDEVRQNARSQGKQHMYISGQSWYKQTASRAVNQAVGRVIRHRKDYGAIILCDERFQKAEQLGQLPAWIRPHVQKLTRFGQAAQAISQFFKRVKRLDLDGIHQPPKVLGTNFVAADPPNMPPAIATPNPIAVPRLETRMPPPPPPHLPASGLAITKQPRPLTTSVANVEWTAHNPRPSGERSSGYSQAMTRMLSAKVDQIDSAKQRQLLEVLHKQQLARKQRRPEPYSSAHALPKSAAIRANPSLLPSAVSSLSSLSSSSSSSIQGPPTLPTHMPPAQMLPAASAPPISSLPLSAAAPLPTALVAPSRSARSTHDSAPKEPQAVSETHGAVGLTRQTDLDVSLSRMNMHCEESSESHKRTVTKGAVAPTVEPTPANPTDPIAVRKESGQPAVESVKQSKDSSRRKRKSGGPLAPALQYKQHVRAVLSRAAWDQIRHAIEQYQQQAVTVEGLLTAIREIFVPYIKAELALRGAAQVFGLRAADLEQLPTTFELFHRFSMFVPSRRKQLFQKIVSELQQDFVDG